MRLVFDHKIFEHIILTNEKEGKVTSKLILTISKLMRFKLFTFPLAVFESVFGFILTLPIPIYSTLVNLFISNIQGLPNYLGMYLRAIYYRKKLKFMGSNVFIDQGVIISNPSEFHICEFSYIDKNVLFLSSKNFIGKRCHISANVFVGSGGDLEIEDHVGIAANVNIITSNENFKNGTRAAGPMTEPDQRNVIRGKVVLKKDVLLLTGSTILPNITVGEGTIVGSGVTISKNTQPWSIHANERPKQIGNREKVIFKED